jgi:hypothetical protein
MTHEIVRKYFTNLHRDDTEYTISCPDEDSSSIFSIDDVVHIIFLSACGKVSGKSILNKIIQIAIELNKNITLHDISTIEAGECKYSLPHYSILSTGISWYNKFHFVSPQHLENVAYNEKIRMLPLDEFMVQAKTNYIESKLRLFEFERSSLLELEKTNDMTDFYYEKYRDIITHSTISHYIDDTIQQIMDYELLNVDEFVHTFNVDKKMPVSDILNHIQIQRTCDKRFRLVMNLIDSSVYLLQYNRHLKLTLVVDAKASRKRKVRKTKIKKSYLKAFNM